MICQSRRNHRPRYLQEPQILKKKRRQEELYEEGGSSGRGTQPPGDEKNNSEQTGDDHSGTLETPSGGEMSGMEESTQTTKTDNHKTDKRGRELEEEGDAAKAIRALGTQRKKMKRSDDVEPKDEPNTNSWRS